jgi:hypothetical protein
MRRKASRMAGGKLPGCKERGEWAELYFMMMVVGLGMKVLRLFGESGRYDVGWRMGRGCCGCRLSLRFTRGGAVGTA